MKQVEGQVSLFDLDSPCGKTSLVPCQVIGVGISDQSSKPSHKSPTHPVMYLSLKSESGNLMGVSWETVTRLPGKSSILNGWEFLNEERESTLSQILEVNAPEKYFLSARACAGILRRAERRGKELPPMLKEALEEVIALDV